VIKRSEIFRIHEHFVTGREPVIVILASPIRNKISCGGAVLIRCAHETDKCVYVFFYLPAARLTASGRMVFFTKNFGQNKGK
jgi:hypothetical protein